MVTFFEDGNQYAVNTVEGLKVISKAIYDCLMTQYRLMGWREEKFHGITNFFPVNP